jgi:hypothetical protein
MTTEAQRIAELEAQLAQLKGNKPSITIKIGNKQNVVVGGTGLKQRFPVTLYAQGWLALLDAADDIRAFIETNKDQLSWK